MTWPEAFRDAIVAVSVAVACISFFYFLSKAEVREGTITGFSRPGGCPPAPKDNRCSSRTDCQGTPHYMTYEAILPVLVTGEDAAKERDQRLKELRNVINISEGLDDGSFASQVDMASLKAQKAELTAKGEEA